MRTLILGVGDLGASKTPGEEIKTFALGSCVALILYDPRAQTAGMAHIALPDSTIRGSRGGAKPGYFADTAIPALIQHMIALRGKNRRGLVVKLVGGARIMNDNDSFDIGRRNVEAVNGILGRHGLPPLAADVGGQLSRTVSIEVDTGKVTVMSPGRAPRTM